MLNTLTTDFILQLQWAFMFIFSSIGGVIANEAYLIIRNNNHRKWNNIYAKIILALFVCFIVHTIYDMKKLEPKFESCVLAIAGFLHYPLGSYIRKDFLPTLGKWFVELLTKGGKKNV